jgi:hypothetical protein
VGGVGCFFREVILARQAGSEKAGRRQLQI